MDAIIPQVVKDTIENAIRNRGWVVNSYAQFENLLSDLVRCAQKLPAYMNIRVPYRTDSRIARVRELLACEGPLKPYEQGLGSFLDRFEQFEGDRLILVHGFCEALSSGGGETITFQFTHWQPKKGGNAVRKVQFFSPSDLEEKEAHFVAFASEALSYFRSIHIEMGWGE